MQACIGCLKATDASSAPITNYFASSQLIQ